MPDNPLRADGARVLADLNALRAIGAYKTGVHKPTFSEPHIRSLQWLAQRLPDAGLTAEIDGIGNDDAGGHAVRAVDRRHQSSLDREYS